jgi:hypothetical protein
LKSFVGGMVSVVPCELDECHVGFVLLRRRAEIPLILTEWSFKRPEKKGKIHTK